jgi:hypothetical protein
MKTVLIALYLAALRAGCRRRLCLLSAEDTRGTLTLRC